MLTITPEQIAAIRAVSAPLPHGVGNAESMCSVAAINLALVGRVTDDKPACMSGLIHRWIIRVQDAMPIDMINAPEWRGLLPYAAGTGNDHEAERAEVLLDWTWTVVLPLVQPVADNGGFGSEWRTMLTEKTANAAYAAANAAYAAADAANAADAACALLNFWQTLNPAAVLRRMILVSVTDDEMVSA